MARPFWAIAAVCAVLIAGCHPKDTQEAAATPAASAAPTYSAPLVSALELKQRQVGDPKLVVVDVRPREAYAREHIEGALNVPWGHLSEGYAQLPKDRFIALYCT